LIVNESLNVSSRHIIVSVIRQQVPDVKLIYLFGSRAKQQETETSDWDLAILGAKKLGSVERWDLAQSIAAKLKQDVDLVDLLQTSTVMQHQVIQDGKVFYDQANFDDTFRMQVLSMYQRLQEGRNDIVQNFIKKSRNA